MIQPQFDMRLMASKVKPKYPIFIPSKNRVHLNLTVKALLDDSIPFYLVIEPQEQKVYAEKYGQASLLILPENNQGLLFARNWIMDYSLSLGAERHWQLDDNIRDFRRYHKGQRIRCHSGVALKAVEDFSDRYENIGLSGMNYFMFASSVQQTPPFYLNCHIYSCTLINNAIPYRWRSVYNDDTDLCLQVLSGGWCTIAFNAFLATKTPTMINKGGNTDELYHGDGRLKMARSLERLWPGVAEVKRRFRRPQHVIKGAWRKFDTPLILKSDIDLSTIKPNNYGLKLIQIKDEVKSPVLRQMLEDQ
jgi:hypothetical protein